MKNSFRWMQLGFEVYNKNGLPVKDLKDIAPYIDEDKLEDLFSNGYYFFNRVHQVRIFNTDIYNVYFGKDNR